MKYNRCPTVKALAQLETELWPKAEEDTTPANSRTWWKVYIRLIDLRGVPEEADEFGDLTEGE